MFRFYLNEKIEDPQNIIIKDKEIINKLTKVLRKKVGDTFILFDNQADEYEVEIKDISSKRIVCKFLNKSFTDRELDVEINLYQALLKKDKFEWLCQKVSEIGVKNIIPVVTEYCVLKELSENKIKRCKKIILEATVQSGGKKIPNLKPIIKYEEAIRQLVPDSLNFIAFENKKENGLADSLAKSKKKKVNLFIGPEGGFSPFEIDLARQNSVISVSLGERILRAETAAIVACGIIANN